MTAIFKKTGLMAALLLLSFFSTAQNNGSLNGKTFFISSASNGRCLDIAEYRTNNGAVVWLWDNANGDNQKWKLEWVRENIYLIRSVSSGKCFDTQGETVSRNGTKLQIWDCLNNANQQWRISSLSNGNYILNPLSAPGRALDADPETAGANGTRIQLWDQHGQTNQQWRLTETGSNWMSKLNGKTVNIVSVANNRCLDIAEYKKDNGSVVWLWDWLGGDNQKWKMEWVRDDIFTIRSISSNRCLDTHAPTLNNNGTIIQIWDCMGNANQQWKLTPLANGNYILNPLSSPRRALDADAPTQGKNGTKLQLWDQHGGHSQQWRINY